MSHTADTDEVVVVSEGGLRVRKSFTADEFPVPVVRFDIESNRGEALTFRLAERIPESFPMDSVGFHPDYQSDNWTAFQDNHVEFEGEIEPEESLVTVYGIRIDEDDDPREFLAEPEVASVNPSGTDADGSTTDADAMDDTMIGEIISDDRNQVVKDMLSGETDSVPGLENDESPSESEGSDAAFDADVDLDLGDADSEPTPSEGDDGDDEADEPDIEIDFGEESIPEDDADVETADDETPEIELDLEAAAAAVDEDDEDDADDAVTDDATDAPSSVADDIGDADADGDERRSSFDTAIDATESVGSRLAAELRDGNLEETDLEAIRSAVTTDSTASERVRIDHLQSRVETVAAYTDAFESFLDENGTGTELIEEFQAELDSFEGRLETFSGRIDNVESALDGVSTSVESVDDRTDDLDDRLGSVETDLGETQDDVDALDEATDDLEGDVEGVTERTDDLESDLETVDSTVETVEASVDSLDDSVDALESDVDSLEDDLGAVREDVTDILEWRDQLGSMFSD